LGDLLTEWKGRVLKRLMVMAMMLAIALVAALPAVADDIAQDNEQEADSGEVDQSFTVTGGGDNSNQCANVQGVAQTGNPQNQLDFLQYVSTVDDFEFEESGSTIETSPANTATCDQQVNQAASASG
jgi:hypothetical protein